MIYIKKKLYLKFLKDLETFSILFRHYFNNIRNIAVGIINVIIDISSYLQLLKRL